MPERDRFRNADGLIPAALLAIAFIPAVAGAIRLVQLGASGEITPGSARFFASPWPAVLHILSSVTYCVLGAFQFHPGFRRRKLGWHRTAGKILVPCGLVAALSALWMTQFYPRGTEPPASHDGSPLYALRLLAASAMVLFVWLGVAAIRRRDVPRHQAWMVRAYAIGLGAGTQALTHVPWFLFPSIQGELARALCMGAGWAINLAVAEWLLSRAGPGAGLKDRHQASPSAFSRR